MDIRFFDDYPNKEEVIDKIKERSNHSKENAEKASKLCTQLVIYGYAIIWLFKNDCDKQGIGYLLLIAILLFSLSILTQIAQYVYIAYIMKEYSWNKILVETESEGVKINQIPNKLNVIAWRFWCLKFIFAISAYIMLGVILANILL